MRPDGAPPDTKGKPGVILPPRFGIATRAVYAGLIGSFLYGYMLCALNSCGGLIPIVFAWCNSEWRSECMMSQIGSGVVNAVLYAGAAAGALANGRDFMATRSSRFQLIVSDIFFALGAVVGACAMGFKALVVSRFLSGLGLGISAIAAPLYIAEVAPTEVRGRHSAKHGLYIAVGLLAAELIGLPQSPPPAGPEDSLTDLDWWYWRVIMLFPLIWALLQAFLLLIVVPIDSPSYLVHQGRVADARALLYRIYGLPVPGPSARPDDENRRLEITLEDLTVVSAEAKAVRRITILEALGDPFLRLSLVVGFFLASYQQLTGINALMAYSNGLFLQAGVLPSNLTLASVAMCVANVLISVVSTRLVDSWGRRSLLLLGGGLQTVSMAILIYVVPSMPANMRGFAAVSCFSVFVVAFSLGLGAVTWLWLSEIYPMEIRGPALSACGVFKWVSCFTIVLCARFLNLNSSCMTFGLITGIGLIGMYLWVLETKGCSMDDSPMTPRSERSQSSLLGAGGGPSGEYEQLTSAWK